MHGTRYSYDETVFARTNDKITILCRIHGQFSQKLGHHLDGHGCHACSMIQTSRSKRRRCALKFESDARKVHGDRYDYSKAVYVNARTELIVVCPRHGDFLVQPTHHLSRNGCRKCGYERVSAARSVSQEHAIERYRRVHGDRYDYSEVQYTGSDNPITVICRNHGPFEMASREHGVGSGCTECAWEKLADERRLTEAQFYDRVRGRHGDKYSYDFTEYSSNASMLTIGCPVHGQFTQQASAHMGGAGCPYCCESKGEKNVAAALSEAGIIFTRQFTDPSCRGKVMPLPFDFAILDQRVLIEFDGVQHHRPIRWAYSVSPERAQEIFVERQRLDAVKTAWASANGWRLVRLTNKETVAADLVSAHVIAPSHSTTLKRVAA